MKIFLMIIMLVYFISLGIYMFLGYLYRVHLFEDMVMLSKNLKNNISFNKNDISTIISAQYKNLHFITKKALHNLNILDRFLKGSDRDCIYNFFNSLGSGDVDFEVSNLLYQGSVLEDRLTFHKDNLKNGNVYLKLIIGLGVLVVIVLL